MKEIEGAGVALVTPFKEDQTIDFDGLARLIDHQINGGIDYLVSLGTTGETATLSKEEKQQVWKFTVDHVNNRVPLVVGIGGNNTREVVDQIKNFDIEGYVAILSVSPYYNKPTQKGIYEHYKAIAEVSPLPIILYNVPGRTGSNMNAETTVRLANEFSNIIATKEACGDLVQISKVLRDAPKGFKVISGDDPITLPMIAMGAVGVISVIANALPKHVSTLVRSSLNADYSKARMQHYQLLELIDLCFVESNPCGVKVMLEQLEICGNQVRLPLTRVSKITEEKIQKALVKLN